MPSSRTRGIVGLGVVLALIMIEARLAAPGASPVPERTRVVRSEGAVPARLVALRASARPLSRPFIWPITGRLTSGFGRRGFWGWHAGVDIVARRGTPIRAAAPGIVTYSGWRSSYGKVIYIAHRGGYSTVYAHNSRNFVKAGDRVERGAIIGAVGRTGHATADHLHLEVRRYGIPRNPLVFLQQQPPTAPPPRHTLG